MRFLLLNTLLLIPLLFSNLFAQNDSIKPDYRNRTNIHEYDPSLMPLNYNNRSTGVWTELNPNVPRVDYLSVDFVGNDTGWAVGANGAIIKTTDAGNKWKTINSNITNVLLNVNSFNGSVVIATGFNGTILRSMDRGESFENIYSGVSVNLWSVKMLNDTLGWICGLNSTLLKTTDGGLNWQLINTGFTGFDYWSLNFLNETIGFIACGNGNILKTINGGESWQLINVGENIQLYTITVFDSLNFLAAGQKNGTLGRIAYTSNGGNSFGYSNAGYLVESISFANDTLGYAVGSEHVLYRTINKGRNWEFINFSEVGEFCIKFLNDSIAYQTGRGLTINKTSDKGYTWSKAILNDNFYDVHFINETTGFAISGSLYKTTTGGLNWSKVENAPGGNDILFLDSLTGFIGGSQTMYKTTDGGGSWYVVNGVPGGARKIFFVNHTTGWATGTEGIFKTTDEGENWNLQLAIPFSNITSIYFVDSLYGWAARINGRPFKTTDGGINWVEQTNLNIWESRDVFFKDVLKGFILESNKFYETTNGGLNWILKPELTGFSVAAKFSYYDSSVIFIIGYKTYRSVNGGTNWIDFNELTGTRVNSLNLLGTGLGYAVGEYGLILKYLDSVYVPVELISFQGKSINNIIILNWQTASEINNKGFEIERSESENQIWKTIRFIQGSGTTAQEHRYSYKEVLENPGKYYYRLKQIDYDGKYEYSPFVEVKINFPLNYSLSQNYPNPFNSTTNINFTIPIETAVKIKLYDITGSEINTLVNKEMKAGYYTIQLSTEGLSSGLYFYKITTGSGYTSVKKLIILK